MHVYIYIYIYIYLFNLFIYLFTHIHIHIHTHIHIHIGRRLGVPRKPIAIYLYRSAKRVGNCLGIFFLVWGILFGFPVLTIFHAICSILELETAISTVCATVLSSNLSFSIVFSTVFATV